MFQSFLSFFPRIFQRFCASQLHILHHTSLMSNLEGYLTGFMCIVQRRTETVLVEFHDCFGGKLIQGYTCHYYILYGVGLSRRQPLNYFISHVYQSYNLFFESLFNYVVMNGLREPYESSKYGDIMEGQQKLWETIPIIYRHLIYITGISLLMGFAMIPECFARILQFKMT